jgi:hypothetical protein
VALRKAFEHELLFYMDLILANEERGSGNKNFYLKVAAILN